MQLFAVRTDTLPLCIFFSRWDDVHPELCPNFLGSFRRWLDSQRILCPGLVLSILGLGLCTCIAKILETQALTGGAVSTFFSHIFTPQPCESDSCVTLLCKTTRNPETLKRTCIAKTLNSRFLRSHSARQMDRHLGDMGLGSSNGFQTDCYMVC